MTEKSKESDRFDGWFEAESWNSLCTTKKSWRWRGCEDFESTMAFSRIGGWKSRKREEDRIESH